MYSELSKKDRSRERARSLSRSRDESSEEEEELSRSNGSSRSESRSGSRSRSSSRSASRSGSRRSAALSGESNRLEDVYTKDELKLMKRWEEVINAQRGTRNGGASEHCHECGAHPRYQKRSCGWVPEHHHKQKVSQVASRSLERDVNVKGSASMLGQNYMVASQTGMSTSSDLPVSSMGAWSSKDSWKHSGKSPKSWQQNRLTKDPKYGGGRAGPGHTSYKDYKKPRHHSRSPSPSWRQ